MPKFHFTKCVIESNAYDFYVEADTLKDAADIAFGKAIEQHPPQNCYDVRYAEGTWQPEEVANGGSYTCYRKLESK